MIAVPRVLVTCTFEGSFLSSFEDLPIFKETILLVP